MKKHGNAARSPPRGPAQSAVSWLCHCRPVGLTCSTKIPLRSYPGYSVSNAGPVDGLLIFLPSVAIFFPSAQTAPSSSCLFPRPLPSIWSRETGGELPTPLISLLAARHCVCHALRHSSPFIVTFPRALGTTMPPHLIRVFLAAMRCFAEKPPQRSRPEIIFPRRPSATAALAYGFCARLLWPALVSISRHFLDIFG